MNGSGSRLPEAKGSVADLGEDNIDRQIQEQLDAVRLRIECLPPGWAPELQVLKGPATYKKAAESDLQLLRELRKQLQLELREVKKVERTGKTEKPKPHAKAATRAAAGDGGGSRSLVPTPRRKSRFRGPARQQQPESDATVMPPPAKHRRAETSDASRGAPPSADVPRRGYTIADVSQGTYPMPLPAVNDVDDSEFPAIEWVTQCFAGEGVPPLQTSFIAGCECTGGCAANPKCLCKAHHTDKTFAYNDDGLLTLKQQFAVFECNSVCRCGPDCVNRVVQRGPKYPLEIFKTRQKGWGVRAKSFIPRWTFVAEYVGEIITAVEAERRGAIYDRLKCSYLYDLDFFPEGHDEEVDSCYTIDAANAGNVARFFNHSCEPNLVNYQVFVDEVADEQRRPRICFFAERDIKVDEELTFDYRYEATDDEGKLIKCHCGAKKCRGKVF